MAQEWWATLRTQVASASTAASTVPNGGERVLVPARDATALETPRPAADARTIEARTSSRNL